MRKLDWLKPFGAGYFINIFGTNKSIQIEYNTINEQNVGDAAQINQNIGFAKTKIIHPIYFCRRHSSRTFKNINKL